MDVSVFCRCPVSSVAGKKSGDGRKRGTAGLAGVGRTSRGITEKMLKSMKKFPGVERLWTVLETEISVSVKEYRGSFSLQGVDLKDYPLTVIQSAGKKNLGNIPLLAVGEDFFQQLQDVGENPVSKRQQVVLRENLSSLVVEIQVLPEGEQEEEAESIPGEFLGVVKERGIYMEQEQMRQCLENQGIHPRLGKICLKIRGKTNVKQAEQSLAQAGFTVEKERVPQSSSS